jgi:hypothetical protein
VFPVWSTEVSPVLSQNCPPYSNHCIRRLFILPSGDRVNTSTYSLDDGTAKAAVGLHLNNDLIALNSFTTVSGSTIDTISIAFGFGPNADALNGTPFQAVLWNDPNGEGNPSDAAVPATANGFVAGAGPNTFVPLPGDEAKFC